ncbi:hypothetical protein NKG94_43315 [Micromonospora sp. M12]
MRCCSPRRSPVRLRWHPRPDRHADHPDFAGTGAGTANPDFVALLAAGDRNADTPASPRAVLRATYVADPASLGTDEDLLLDTVLSTATGDDNYRARRCRRRTGRAPRRGARVLNALAPTWFRLADELVAVAEKPRSPGYAETPTSSSRTPRCSTWRTWVR